MTDHSSPPRVFPDHAIVLGVALVLLAVSGCSSAQAVLLRVTSPDGSEPMRMAYVQVTPLNASPVPLPLSLDTINEYLSAKASTGFTDTHGEFSFSTDPARPHEIVISEPARKDVPLAEASVWRGVLDRDGQLHPLEAQRRPAPATLRVEIVNRRTATQKGQGT